MLSREAEVVRKEEARQFSLTSLQDQGQDTGLTDVKPAKGRISRSAVTTNKHFRFTYFWRIKRSKERNDRSNEHFTISRARASCNDIIIFHGS